MRRHVILVGLPGSGKSTVGALLAAELGAPFVDLDPLIEARAGKSVPRLFAEQGEGGFRRLESEVGEEALRGPPAVIAPGGGFVVDREQRERARTRGLVVYLKTSAEVAAERLGPAPSRPLLEGRPARDALAELLRLRRAAYQQAEATVTTDGLAPSEVAARVAELARRLGGW